MRLAVSKWRVIKTQLQHRKLYQKFACMWEPVSQDARSSLLGARRVRISCSPATFISKVPAAHTVAPSKHTSPLHPKTLSTVLTALFSSLSHGSVHGKLELSGVVVCIGVKSITRPHSEDVSVDGSTLWRYPHFEIVAFGTPARETMDGYDSQICYGYLSSKVEWIKNASINR
jgi:hypothetical protein